jgi:hypothetical protein
MLAMLAMSVCQYVSVSVCQYVSTLRVLAVLVV